MKQRKRPAELVAPDGRERRSALLSGVTVQRAELAEGEPIPFHGVASTFMQPYALGNPARWGFWEQIARDAFDGKTGVDGGGTVATLEDPRTAMLKNHNTDLPLARAGAGSLDLASTDDGLEVDARMDATTYALDLALSLASGTVDQMSFGFSIRSEKWEILSEDTDWGGHEGEELVTVWIDRLWEVSPVTFPANPNTEAELASASLRHLRTHLDLSAEDVIRLDAALRRGERSSELRDHLDAVAKRLEPADPAPGVGTGTPAGDPIKQLADRHRATAMTLLKGTI